MTIATTMIGTIDMAKQTYNGWTIIYPTYDQWVYDYLDTNSEHDEEGEKMYQSRVEVNFEVNRLAAKLVSLMEEKYPDEFTALMKDAQTKNWWKKYKAEYEKAEQLRISAEQRRIQEEKIKEIAMSKLSEEEKALFGLSSKPKRSRKSY